MKNFYYKIEKHQNNMFSKSWSKGCWKHFKHWWACKLGVLTCVSKSSNQKGQFIFPCKIFEGYMWLVPHFLHPWAAVHSVAHSKSWYLNLGDNNGCSQKFFPGFGMVQMKGRSKSKSTIQAQDDWQYHTKISHWQMLFLCKNCIICFQSIPKKENNTDIIFYQGESQDFLQGYKGKKYYLFSSIIIAARLFSVISLVLNSCTFIIYI